MSSFAAAGAASNSHSAASSKETAVHQYLRQFADYFENGMDFPELSQIRQLDVALQDCHRRMRETAESLRTHDDDPTEKSRLQAVLINALVQAKVIGDKKMQLSQQMLDATERQAKKLHIAQQEHVESTNQTAVPPDATVVDSENEYESESGLCASVSRTSKAKDGSMGHSDHHRSLWKRRATVAPTMGLKRRCVINAEQSDKANSVERDRRRLVPRAANTTIQSNTNGTGRRLRLNNESTSSQSDETTYCLCSQLSYGSMILCDSKSCEIKWFHFNCVQLTTKPKGKWFCPRCRDSRI